jgi:hypothetical protein
MLGWEVLAKFPESLEDLVRFHLIVLTGVDSDLLILYPYERSLRAAQFQRFLDLHGRLYRAPPWRLQFGMSTARPHLMR